MEIIKDLGISLSKAGYRRRYVIAKCPCGNTKKVLLNAIKSGNTTSCGCGYNRKTPITSYKEYWVLQGMKQRCYNKNKKYYYLYGGRGISICSDWLDNAYTFIDWCNNNGYKKGLYIDRINPNGNYHPNNCRFVDSRVNATNTRLLSSSNKSGYRGVSKHIKKNGDIIWRARIGVFNKTISLGVFIKKIDAAKAYNNYIIINKLEHPLN